MQKKSGLFHPISVVHFLTTSFSSSHSLPSGVDFFLKKKNRPFLDRLSEKFPSFFVRLYPGHLDVAEGTAVRVHKLSGDACGAAVVATGELCVRCRAVADVAERVFVDSLRLRRVVVVYIAMSGGVFYVSYLLLLLLLVGTPRTVRALQRLPNTRVSEEVDFAAVTFAAEANF